MKQTRPTLRLPLSASIAALLVMKTLSANAGTVWDGGGSDDFWNTPSNWNDNVAPVPGQTVDLTFGGTVRLTPNNNFAALEDFHSITFGANAGAFTLSGNAIDLFGKIENLSTAPQTIAFDIAVNSGQSGTGELNPVNGDLFINSTNVFTNGNTLHVNGVNNKTITFGANTVISQAGSFNVEQASNVIFLGANTYTGATKVLAGSLTVGDGGITGLLGTGAVTIASGATLSFNRGDAIAPANTFTVGGTLVQNGTGTMTIATSQPGITGTVAINAGRITMGANDSLGTAAITLNGGTIERNAANVTVSNNITVGPNGGTILGRQVVDNYSAFSGVLSGSGPLTVQGLVTLTNPANTYAGDILVSNASASYLRLVGTNVIGTTSNVTLGTNANFRLEGTTPSQTIASLNGTAGRIFTVSPGAVLIVGNNNADGTYNGTIDNGTGQLTFQKTGTGTQILSRAAGNGAALTGVVVNGGTLKLSGTGVAFNAGYFTGTTPITVNAGGTLEIAGAWNTSSTNIYTLNGGTMNFTLAGTEPNANYVNNLNIIDGAVSGNAFRTGNLAAGVAYNVSGNLGSTVSAAMGMVKNGATQTVTLNVNDGTADADLTISGGIHDVTNYAGTTLVKNGPGKLVMTGANTYNGPTTVANGTLQIGNGGTSGVPGLGEITNNASLVFNRSNSVTISNTISGSGSLTHAGTGSTMLTGTLNYTGPTLVNAGKLFVNSVLSPGSSVTVGGGATLGGSGIVSDGVTVNHNGIIESGDGTSTGTLTLGTLTLGAVAGNLSAFNLAAGSTAAVIVTGNNGLVANGGAGSAKINIGGGIPTLGTHVLIDYAETLGGGFGAFTLGTLPNRVLATLVNNTSNTSIDLNVTGVDFPVWKGAQSSEWSTNTIGPGKNWVLNSNNATGTDYLSGDTVVFNDVATNTTVDVSVADVLPVSVTFNNSTKNYTITGTKAIAGATALTKSGSGTLTINNTNSFTGATTINAGTVSVGTVADSGLASPLGAGSNITFGGGSLEFTGTAGITNRSITLSSGGGTIRTADSLTLTGSVSGSDPLTKSGSGTLTLTAANNNFFGDVTASQGTLNSTNNNAFGSGSITLGSPATGASDVALILSNRVDISNSITVASDGTGKVVLGADASGTGANAASFLGTVFLNRATTFSSQVPNDRLAFDGQITGSPGTITVTGGSRTTWRNLANDFTGNVVVTGIGTVLQASVASASEVIPDTANLQVDSDAELWLASTGGQTETIAGLTGSGTVRSYNLSSLGGTRTLAVGFGGATSEFAGTIANGADPVALQKIDSGKFTLSGTNVYTGATSIDGGTLALTGSISGTTSITVQSGANFDVSGVAGGYHLDVGQTLKGDGTVLGATTIDGSLAPGLAIGTLKYSSNLVLNGSADFEIDKSFGTLTADLVRLANGILTLGGILNVTATGDTLMPGDTFNLFDAPTTTGSFAVLNLPLLSNPNYSWDTSKLAVNGTITVIPEPGTTAALVGGIGLLLGLPRRRRTNASRR